MTLTLEEAAEKVLRAARQAAYVSANRVAGLEDKTDELMEALRTYGDQRFIEGATAMREMAAKVAIDAHDAQGLGWTPYSIALGINTLDPNQLKDTDHG